MNVDVIYHCQRLIEYVRLRFAFSVKLSIMRSVLLKTEKLTTFVKFEYRNTSL